MATIGAIHDLSGVGRCSLTVAIGILNAMGHECRSIPTAVLSNQTGFPGYSYLDFTPYIPAYLEGWDRLGAVPETIYTGFLGSAAQPELLSRWLEGKNCTILVDPVMGDNGALYSCYDREFVASMRRLVSHAHVITPNLTEFWLLLGRDPATPPPAENDQFVELAGGLSAPHLRYAVITGVLSQGQVTNLIVDLEKGEAVPVSGAYTGVSYSGSGDIFASVLCGHLANGADVPTAVRSATAFLCAVIAAMPSGSDPRYGIAYERHLSLLVP